MAQQYIRRYDALGAKTTAPPVLSLPSQAPQAMDNEPEFFQMDSLDFMWQGEGFDPFPVWSDEIDQGQTYDQPGAHLASIEAGSAYKSLVGQLPAGAIKTPETQFEADMNAPGSCPQMNYSAVSQITPSVCVPASMPLPIPTFRFGNSPTPPTQQLRWASLPEQDQDVFVQEGNDAFPITYDFMDPSIPSASPFSAYSTQSSWSNQHGFAQHMGPTYAPSVPITSQSSFNIAQPDFSSQTPKSMPPLSRSVGSHISFLVENARNGSPQERGKQHAPRFESQSQGVAQESTANLSAWAQGTYNVLDRTSFGSLAPPATTPTKRRRASRSRSRSVATLACEDCDKTFGSKSERDHHTRWHGPRDRICMNCGKGFVASKDLKRHEKIHKPLEAHEFFCSVQGCPYERRGFARKDHLTRHQKTHVGDLDPAGLMSMSFPF